ncbi:hypothetical protein [Rheinheimera pacifica]|uniref:hypothetical protein n=1 Tax=Rheinheimera pacifica TaxID=173990 RepID=UPI002ED8BC01
MRGFILLLCFISFSVFSYENYEVVVCDGCSYNQSRVKARDSISVDANVIVMDVSNRNIYAFQRYTEYDSAYANGFRVFVFDVGIPHEWSETFQDYIKIYDLVNSNSVEKVWNAVPKQLSPEGVSTARATIQGLPYPIPRHIASSVNDVFDDLDSQRYIGLELNRAYLATVSMRFKVLIHKFFTARPFVITVKFIDDTTVDFMLISPEFTLPWAIMPDTALDSQGRPIVPPSNTKHQFSGGFNEGRYHNRYPVNNGSTTISLGQSCRTAFTGINGKLVSQLVCWAIP